jgi:hypothetical protein
VIAEAAARRREVDAALADIRERDALAAAMLAQARVDLNRLKEENQPW